MIDTRREALHLVNQERGRQDEIWGEILMAMTYRMDLCQ